jgi:hypothetical protein
MGSHPPKRERREHPRFLFPESAACRVRPLQSSSWWLCRGLDVSLGGLAIVLPEAPSAGQLLLMELRRANPELLITRLLRVAYCIPIVGGGYRVGGQFQRLLAPAELDGLLQCPGAGDIAESAFPTGRTGNVDPGR